MELISAAQLAKFAAALILVLAMMAGLGMIMRRFASSHAFAASERKRLRIVESLPIDGRRRAVLIRRDDREHLIILGANGETVVETGIESKQDTEDGQ
jgi:flagellar protein FliO/FliZ